MLVMNQEPLEPPKESEPVSQETEYTDARGISCPKCKCGHVIKIDNTVTRKNIVFRYKSCQNCGCRFRTSTRVTERVIRIVRE